MGIPVPTKRMDKALPPKYAARSFRYSKRADLTPEYPENELSPSSTKIDDFKRNQEISRMGNYFNIVIAPPPIKALQPRKIVQNDPYRSQLKRF